MRVLHLIDSAGLYGAEKMLLTLVKEQKRQGLEPLILSASMPGEDSNALDLEAEVLGLPIVRWAMRDGLNFGEAFRISRWAVDQQFDIFHSHGYKFDILIGLMPKWIRRLPVIATSHGYTYKKLISKMGLYSIVDRFSLFLIEGTVGVSQHQSILRLGPFRRRRVVIENGIDIHTPMQAETGINPEFNLHDINNVFKVCAVGRLSEEKGFDLLIEAVSQLNVKSYNIQLTIAGEGPQRTSLEAQVEALDLGEVVEFLGYISDVELLFNRSDLFVISSHTEGLPITLLEAMKASIPVVATSVGAIPDVLVNGKYGVLIDPGHAKNIEEGIVQAFNLSPENSRIMTKKARIALIKKYSAKVMSDKYIEQYKRIIV